MSRIALAVIALLAAPLVTAPRSLDIQAHRGGSALAPGNTLDAFRNAIDLRVPTIELDLQVTADGTLKVAHDADADLGRAPAFAEVLDLCRQAPYPVRLSAEIKRQHPRPGQGPRLLAALLVDELDREGFTDRVIVQCFDPDVLRAVRDLAPSMPTAMLVRDASEIDAMLERSRATILSPRIDVVRREDIERLHARGIQVIPWVVNDVDRARELAGWGVDGLITDHPDVIMDALAEREAPREVAADPSGTPPAPRPQVSAGPALTLADIRRVAVYPFTSGGNVDTFCTSLFVQEARDEKAFREIIDSYELSVTTPDGAAFQPQPMLPQLLQEARDKGADAIVLGEGKWYDWGFRMEFRLIEVNQGRVVWQCAVASGFHFSGPSAKKELATKAVADILRRRR